MSRMAIGVLAAVLLCALSSRAADKQLKPGEFEPYNAVVIDVNTGNFAKALADLDAWKQKFPDTDFQDERLAFYVQAYAGANQPAQGLSAAVSLFNRNLDTEFGPDAQPTVIRLLYATVWAVSRAPDPSRDELAAGEKAAHLLMAYDRQLPNATPEQWAKVRGDMREKASAALLHIAMLPGTRAMAAQPPDCATAEAVYTGALAEYPDKSAVSYELGRALSCLAKTQPDKLSAAIYEFERAAMNDSSARDSADKYYVKIHGSDEGLEGLKQLVKESPLAPPGFHIRTGAEIAEEQRAEFEKSNPQLALWMKIKAALSETDGDQYFAGSLKDAAVPPLRGTLVDAKPACRPQELWVAVPLPGAAEAPAAEIRLKLDKPLSGKPELHGDFQWEGIPSAFTRQPFLLTMTADPATLQGVKTTPCGVTKKR